MGTFKQMVLKAVILLIAEFSLTALKPGPAPETANPVAVFDAVLKTTKEHFYDAKRVGPGGEADLAKRAPALRLQLSPESSPQDLQRVVDQLLSPLEFSHSGMLMPDDQEYWAIQSAFSKSMEEFRTINCGVLFERHGATFFVREVYLGTPAAKAGLLRGDQIVTPNFSPVTFCRSVTSAAQEKTSKKTQNTGSVTLLVKHLPGKEAEALTFSTVSASVSELLLTASKKSTHIYPVGHKLVGYFRLGAGTNESFLWALQDAVAVFAGKEASTGVDAQPAVDAMVLDLRGGLGGASPAYTRPFLKPTAGLDKPPKALTYSKSLVVLIDGRTTGGKEALAWVFKHERGATLVGEPTPGQLLPGQVFDLAPHYAMLYLAVASPKGLAAKLEGHGVAPDIAVDDPLLFAAGADPILKKGLETAYGMTQPKPGSR